MILGSLCCDPVGTGGPNGGDDECHCTMANIGTGVDNYQTGSTVPFNIRRTQAIGDVVITTVTDPGVNDSNRINHTVNLATRLGLLTLIASPAKDTLTPGNVRLFLKSLEAGTNITFDNITADSARINSTGGAAGSMANIGTGLDVYEAASSSPFNVRRINVINDLTVPHGRGNLARWTDGQTNRIDLPRLHFQSNASVNPINVPQTLIDHTFTDDSAGAGVAGADGEDWHFWWNVKICGDSGQPLIDAFVTVYVHNGAAWVLVDSTSSRPVTNYRPSWPHSGQIRLDNTNWSGNGGLRIMIQGASDHFAVNILFEEPRLTLLRYNEA